ncbi:MAG: class II poly(R)-hydroxyalkanoic acid synthase [Pseudomonadales bacterium]
MAASDDSTGSGNGGQETGSRPGWIDAIAERTEGVAAASAFGVDTRAIIDTWGTIIEEAAAQPRALLEAGRQLSTDLGEILLGRSDIGPDAKDPRFADPAWKENPLFKRIGQSYVAWTRSLDHWLERSGLDGMERERARFVLDAAKDVMAPVNALLANPQALRKVGESRGASLVQGFRNFLEDLRYNHGYPSVADRNAFELGRDVAASEGAVVFRNDLLELIQYTPKTAEVSAVPFLYVFSQVNRFYLGDLTPDRSLFQRLLDAGITVFAVSWKNPTADERDWNLDTYAAGVIDAIRVMRQITKQDRIHLMGLCAGGLVAAAAAGALRARDEDWVETLSLFVNVLDFRPEDSDFGLFVSERSVDAQKAMVRTRGVFTERNVFEMFALLRIEDNIMNFFRSNYLLGEAPLKHPLLFWSQDYTRVPAEMQCDFLDLSQYNRIAKKEKRILGKRIDLSKIRYPVYLMAGTTDHITPWKACYRSTQLFGGDITFVLTNQNHTQTISGRLDNRHLRYWIPRELPADPHEALHTAEEHSGSWTFHWIDWLKAHGGEQVPAPKKIGSKKHPPLYPAPGQYVRES